MPRFATAVLTLLVLLQPIALKAKERFASLPPPFADNADLVERYWSWLIAEVGAPDDLEVPPVAIEALPRNIKMAFFFPTKGNPGTVMRIAISKRAQDRAHAGKQLEAFGELAHELAHYVLLMAEHDFDFERVTFEPAVHDHCDLEFRRLTKHAGTVVWNAYHSNDAVRAIDQMVQKSCWETGHHLNPRRSTE